MNVFEKLATCRVELQKKELKKSGKNKFAGFEYYELKDFIPAVNELFLKYKLFSNFSIKDSMATLTIYDTEKEDQTGILFTSPIAEANVKGCTPIQSLGAVHTYMKRYLYMNALEIVESDVLDAEIGTDKLQQKTQEQEQADNDIDIIEGLKACDNTKNLQAYYERYRKSVRKFPIFRSAYLKTLSDLNKGAYNE